MIAGAFLSIRRSFILHEHFVQIQQLLIKQSRSTKRKQIIPGKDLRQEQGQISWLKWVNKNYKSIIFEMIEENSCEFINWVKIRIGEPLTALEIDKQKVNFGSISGYIGYYDIGLKKVHYFQPINEEIIRGIYSDEKGKKMYYAIGDRHVLIKNLIDEKGDERISIVRQHSNNVCSHSMTMMYGLKQVIFCAFPTQKRQSMPTQLQLQKSNLYEIDIKRNEITTHREFKPAQVFVPFDFDGERILWMEYKQGGVKEFQTYELAKKQINTIYNFGNKYHFISFGRILGNDVIFIENNKNVKLLNLQNNTIMDLYEHSSSIIAFDIADREEKYYTLASIDFNGIYKQWKNNAVVRTHSLWKAHNVPEQIRKHQLLFDMGYPYYMKLCGNLLAVTTDLGLCIFKV